MYKRNRVHYNTCIFEIEETKPGNHYSLISKSKGGLDKLWRTLRALYHPGNHYVLHIDLESESDERIELASRVEKDPMFTKLVTYRGATMVSNILHACAILLKWNQDWDRSSSCVLWSEARLEFVEYTSQLVETGKIEILILDFICRSSSCVLWSEARLEIVEYTSQLEVSGKLQSMSKIPSGKLETITEYNKQPNDTAILDFSPDSILFLSVSVRFLPRFNSVSVRFSPICRRFLRSFCSTLRLRSCF
ncbi:hypothetical protein L1887_10977 [Cichorium endivia]|nr:hypothetical protein L1887_10977 [Cichorium endivia]